ncbi:hypothetical protein [Leptospira neocaledonica]|uniref:Uncharacterized protein n=1 Tax=Leptospira neocaledonica TaxID=2023192 RepID=A0A2M9ZTA7_9LEPT|nr:hypothetical protein [Leptospira neocaledonica]PJZ75340.1 hypothetical protein CH365_19430 [Leptospira neocaledonica]
MLKRVLIIFVAGALVGNCLGFHSKQLGEINISSKSPGAKTISMAFSMENTANGMVSAMSEEGIRVNKSFILDTFVKSGVFKDVIQGEGKSDLFAETKLTRKDLSSNGLFLLSAITLSIIPSYITSEFTLETTFKDKAGKVLGKVLKENKMTHFNWLPTFLLMPFFSVEGAYRKAIDELAGATLAEATTKGFF